MTDIQGPARLGKDPVYKKVGAGEDKKEVCELRACFQNYRKSKTPNEQPKDTGFWVQVNVWGKLAEPVSRLFKKGDRVFIIADMDQDSFSGQGGEDVSLLQANSNLVLPWTMDIEMLKYKDRKPHNDTAQDTGDLPDDDDIPL